MCSAVDTEDIEGKITFDDPVYHIDEPGTPGAAGKSLCQICRDRAIAAFAEVVVMFKVPSFWIIVLQGVFGAIPWHTFGFLTCVTTYMRRNPVVV